MPSRCLGCMQIRKNGAICEHCGYEESSQNQPHQLPAGSVLREQYLVGRVLGQGGFGITYIGWDMNLEMPIAIKEYFPSGIVNRDSNYSLRVFDVLTSEGQKFRKNRERFVQEARILARLRSIPGIVHVHNFFLENDTAYIIMEYLQGTDLRSYARNRGGRIAAAELLPMMRPVLKALHEVHQAELVHRDISPDNIMVMRDGSMKLLDFGAVREVADADAERNLVQSTEAILKHGFAPIEQYQRRGSLGPWSDVYAVCATIYYLLTGKLPPDATERLTGEEDVDWSLLSGLTTEQVHALQKGMSSIARERTSSVENLYRQLYGMEITAEFVCEESLHQAWLGQLEPQLQQEIVKKTELLKNQPNLESESDKEQVGQQETHKKISIFPANDDSIHSQRVMAENVHRARAESAVVEVHQKQKRNRKKGLAVVIAVVLAICAAAVLAPNMVDWFIREPIQIVQQPQDVTANKGEDIEVCVDAKGDGLRYQWYFQIAASETFRKTGIETNNYQLTMYEYYHDSRLYCVISDEYGNTVKTNIVTITIPGKKRISENDTAAIKIIKQPESIEAYKGDYVEVSVEAEGNGLRYQWYFKAASKGKFQKSGNGINKYQLRMHEYYDDSRLYCEITDEYGNIVRTDTITLEMK